VIRAAIYARKSTTQERGETGDSLSVEEQVAGAKAFIEACPRRPRRGTPALRRGALHFPRGLSPGCRLGRDRCQ
jgi:hypothetical protein